MHTAHSYFGYAWRRERRGFVSKQKLSHATSTEPSFKMRHLPHRCLGRKASSSSTKETQALPETVQVSHDNTSPYCCNPSLMGESGNAATWRNTLRNIKATELRDSSEQKHCSSVAQTRKLPKQKGKRLTLHCALPLKMRLFLLLPPFVVWLLSTRLFVCFGDDSHQRDARHSRHRED